MPEQIHGHQIPDDVTIPCSRCDSTGWLEYDVDYFGRKQAWGRCNEPGCRGGEVAIEAEETA